MNLYQIQYENRYVLIAALTARNAANILKNKTPQDHILHGVNLCDCDLELVSDAYYPQNKEMIITDEEVK